MPSAKNLPLCPECKALRDKREQPKPLEHLQRLSSDDLATYAERIERIKRGGVLHDVAPQSIVGLCESESWQRCSYFDHRHHEGVLVWTSCRKLLLIGLVCGRDLLGGAEIDGLIRRFKRLDAERALQQTSPGQVLRGLRDAAASVRRVVLGMRTMAAELSPLYTKLKHSPPRYIDVPLRKTRDGKRITQSRPLFVGPIFSFESIETELGRAVVKAEAYNEQMRTLHVSYENEAAVRRQRGELERVLNDCLSWLRDVAKFWSETNLMVACYHGLGDNMLQVVAIDGPRIRILRSGTTVGFDGVFKAKKAA